MTCPSCGARNGRSSAWCTQCFAPLGASAPPPAELLPPGTTAAPAAAPAASSPAAPAPAPPSPRSPSERAIRAVGDDLEWRCARCGRWTALTRHECATCAAPRAGFGDDPRPTRSLGTGAAVLLGAVLPGAAHLVVGRLGSGVARLVLALGWAAVAVTAWGPGGAPSPVAATFLGGALAVWLGTVLDSAHLDRPAGRELLRSRVLLVLVAAVTVVGLLAVLVDALG